MTADDALAGLVTVPEPEETVRGRWGHLLADIPPGDNYLHYTAERGHPDPVFEWRSRYWSFLLKLSPDRPSPTIQAQPGPNVGPFHWENRRLRVPELRRLFTFPDDFAFVGRRTSVQAQVGNPSPRCSPAESQTLWPRPSASTSMAERWRTPFASSEAVQRKMSRLARRDTAPELALRSVLHRRGLRYRVHRRPLPDLARQADIVFSGSKVAVFVDGCFWHG